MYILSNVDKTNRVYNEYYLLKNNKCQKKKPKYFVLFYPSEKVI